MVKEAFQYVIKTIVDKPESVVIDELHEDSKVKIIVKVDDQDMGKIIGKEGRTIKALRTLAAVMSHKDQVVTVDVAKQ